MTSEEKIREYKPFDYQEKVDKESYLKFINTFEDVLTRDNIFGHFTSSAFVVNEERNKMLVVYHNILDGWIFPGGHADGEEDLLSVAIREVEEETGLKTKILDKEIFSIQVNPVKGHIKNGAFVSSHLHYDVIYLLEANEHDKLSFREEESKGVKWIDFEETSNNDIVDFARPVNKKLIKKLSNIKKSN